MKKFFSTLLKVCFSICFVFILILTLDLFIAWSNTRGQCSFLIAPSGVEVFYVNEGLELPLHEVKMSDGLNYENYVEKKVVDLARILLIWSPFQIGHAVFVEDYLSARISANGSYVVLSFTAISNVVLLGWVLIVAVVATYRDEISNDLKKFRSLFKKKQKQV